MPAVAAGNLRDRVQLQRKATTQSPTTGEMLVSWATVATVWADMHYQSVREFVAASAEQSEVRGYAMIRFRSDVDATWRLYYRGRYYAILGVMPDNESGREHLTLALAEGVRLDQ
jgi:SPP1 family predicted phage head-tail adaptor